MRWKLFATLMVAVLFLVAWCVPARSELVIYNLPDSAQVGQMLAPNIKFDTTGHTGTLSLKYRVHPTHASWHLVADDTHPVSTPAANPQSISNAQTWVPSLVCSGPAGTGTLYLKAFFQGDGEPDQASAPVVLELTPPARQPGGEPTDPEL